VIAAAGGAAFGIYQAYRIHFSKDPPNPNPTFRDVEAVAVGTLSSFAEVWQSADFVVGGWPCVAIRLPEAIPGGVSSAAGAHFAAFTRICTHQYCLVEYKTDTEAVAFAFNHRSATPSLACACHFSVFDPLRAGRAVSGPAVRPLPRARLRIDEAPRGALLLADGLELT
jgi:Rieske Fe-S protein